MKRKVHKPSARWRRRKDARPQEILEAALAVFAERGFAAARMEDISRRAGVTKGTLYLYFESKEALFKALVRSSIAPAIAEAVKKAQGFAGPSRELLRQVLGAIGTFICTSNRIVLPKIIIAEAGNFPELAQFYRNEIIAQGLGLFETIIARGIGNGEFREIEPRHAARLCIAPLLLSAFWRVSFDPLDDSPYDHASLIEAHIDVLLRGLSGGAS